MEPTSLLPRTPVRLHPRCGACGTRFRDGDRTTAVLEISSGIVTKVEGPSFGYSGSSPTGGTFFTPFNSNKGEADSATFHNDCLNLFTQSYAGNEDPLYLAWFLAKSMNPADRDAIHLFPPALEAINPLALAHVTSKLNFPQGFKHLPTEIARMIWSHDPSAEVWRYSRVFTLLGLNVESNITDQFDGPLLAIHSWVRGQEPVLKSGNDIPGAVTRLTFDFNGLLRIEQLQDHFGEYPQGSSQEGSRLYMIERPTDIWQVEIQFKYNCARLWVPAETRLKIWEMPTPPSIDEWALQPLLGRGTLRMKGIQTHKCTGLTFFIYPGGLIEAVHAHTKAAPSAQKTFNELAPSPPTMRPSGIRMWVYVPFTNNNPIVGFGVRVSEVDLSRPVLPQRPGFLFRMKLSGDVVIGSYDKKARDFVTSTEDWPIIFHDGLDSKDTIWNFGAYPKVDGQINIATPSPSVIPNFAPYKSCVSLASLNKVVQTRVYYNPGNGGCWGILFYYENGTQASVGQCRILVDPFEECSMPSNMCFSTDRRFYRLGDKQVGLVRVKFLTQDEFVKNGKGNWQNCYSMSGTIYFFFQNEQAGIVVDY